MRTLLDRFFGTGKAGKGKGRFYETRAMRFLKRQGFRDFQTNFHSRHGEIDLIARHGEVLVFIEVRYRESSDHGSPLATVDYSKQRKIRLAARHFLQKNGLTDRIPCRFDVIGITGGDGNLEYHWIRNAF